MHEALVLKLEIRNDQVPVRTDMSRVAERCVLNCVHSLVYAWNYAY